MTRLRVSILLWLFMATNGRSQQITYSDAQINAAIERGVKNRGKFMGLVLSDVAEQLATGISHSLASVHPQSGPASGVSGFSVILYTPLTWISQEASDAAKEYRTFTRADVTPEMLVPVLRVIVRPNTPSTFTSEDIRRASSAEHVVLRDVSRKRVMQPLTKDSFSETLGNAMGATTSYEGVTALFDLGAVQELRNGNEEFFVTVVGNKRDRDFKVKSKHFASLFESKELAVRPQRATNTVKTKPERRNAPSPEQSPRLATTKQPAPAKETLAMANHDRDTLQQKPDVEVEQKKPGCLGIIYQGNVHEPRDGVEITAVSPRSPADEIGLQAGDYLTAVGGHFFTRAEDLFQILSQYSTGTQVTIQYRRGRLIYETNVVLAPCANANVK